MTDEAGGGPLAGKVALVTGASRGIGRCVAVALGRMGVHVACVARATRAAPLRLPGTVEDAAEDVERAGAQALALAVDLSREGEAERMVERAAAHFGRLDLLVNNAAVSFPGDLGIAPRRFDLIMAINVRAPFLATRAALPHMRAAGGGAVLNVSSAAALHVFPGLMAYGMSKAALERLTIDCAAQLASDGIAVNCFRIDVPVATEGFVANMPAADHAQWEKPETAAAGVVWMLQQPPSYSGRILDMREWQRAHGR